MLIQGDYVDGNYGQVTIDGHVLDPADSLKLRDHSPDGFSWGYEGSGPAQLALAILLWTGMEEEQALDFYQQFKSDYLAKLDAQKPFQFWVDPVSWLIKKRIERRTGAPFSAKLEGTDGIDGFKDINEG
jgi:hypothetical protein